MLRLLVLLALTSPLLACDLIDDLLDDSGDLAFLVDSSGTATGLSGTDSDLGRLWTVSVGTEALDSAAGVAAGELVAVGYGTLVTAIDSAEGTIAWTRAVDDSVVAMAADGSRVYALSFTVLTAIALADGEIEWVLDFAADAIPGVAHEALAAGGGVVVLGGDPVRILDPETGAVRASWASGDDQMRAVGVGGGTVFVAHAGGLTGLGTDGGEDWTLATAGEVDNLVVSGSEALYSVAGGGVGWADGAGGAVWTVDDGGLYDSLAFGGGVAVGARTEGVLTGWDSGGEEAWVVEDLRTPVRGLAASGPSLFVAAGNVVGGVDFGTGDDLWGEWSPEGTPLFVGAR